MLGLGWRPSRRFVVAVTACALLGSVLAQIADAAPNIDTTITSVPANPTNQTTASFGFTASQGGATFTCKLDTSAPGACTSPKSYTGLTAGSHTFSVYATKGGTSDPTPASATWTVDLTSPTVPGGLTGTALSSSSVRLNWTASTDNVGLAGYNVFRDGAQLATIGTVTTYTDSTVTAGSTHTYAVRSRDTAGNSSALTTAVSVTSLPDTIITSSPASPTNQTTASFAFSASTAGAMFTCKLDAGATGACTSPKSYTDLTAGTHTFSVFAIVDGVADPTPATSTWTVDLTLPTTPGGLSATALSSSSVQLNWTASTDNVAVAGYDVIRDGAQFATVGAVTTYTDSTVVGSSTYAYAVRARDTAGNTSALTAAVSVTTPAPLDTLLDGAPPASTSSTSAAFYFHSTSSTATFSCTLDTGTAGACTSPKSYTGLTLGTHTFEVTSTAGGTIDGTPATFTWSVVTTSGGTGPGALTADPSSPTSVELAWSAVTSATRYTVERDGVTQTTTTALSSTDSTVLAGSTHTYVVTATVGGVETGPSPTATATTPSGDDAASPTTPGNLTVTATGTGSVTLAFSASTDDFGVLGYFIRINGILYAYTEGALTANVPNLKASTTYGIDVAALDAAGNTSVPAHINATTAAMGADTVAPAAPKLTATPYSATQVDLSWSKPTDADLAGYLVFQGATQIADLPANTSTQTRVSSVTGLVARTAYTFLVRSYDTKGNQSSASSLTVTTLDTNDVRVSRGPIVERIGTSSARIVWRTNVAASSSVTYNAGGTVYTTIDPTVTTDHNVLVGSLPASSSVAYTVNGTTPVNGSLQTCGATPGTLNFDAVGDMGGGALSETNIANLVTADHAALIGSVGDNVYPTGSDKDFPDRLLNPYQTAFANAGFFTAFGNHEYYDPGAAATRRMFPQPGNGTFFSFDCSGVHFSVVDTFQPFAPGTAQYQWLANDLAGSAQPAKVVLLHVPPYSSSVQNVPGSTSTLNSLYERYGVQLVIGGHSHNYERTNVINGVTYVVDGGGGNGLNPFSGTPPSWSAYREAAYSYLRLVFSPSGITGRQVHEDGTIGDSFTLPARPPGPPDTVIDSSPTGRVGMGTATLSFYSIPNGAAFTCKLDTGAPVSCTSPMTYSGLADGPHTVTVTGSNQYGVDATPASATWVVDTSSPVFADGFETGDLAAWTTSAGTVVQANDKRTGSFAAEAVAAGSGAYARKTLAATLPDVYLRVGYKLKSQTGQANLVRVRTATGASIGYLYLTPTGILGFHNDATATNTLSAITPGTGWHTFELHLGINGTSSVVEVWLDGALVGPLTSYIADLGSTPAGALQIGESSAQTYDVLFDDAAVATARLGTTSDGVPPSAPSEVTGSATSPFSVRVDWTASTDDTGVTGYDIFRDGVPMTSVDALTTTASDSSVLAGSTHTYAVRARDSAGNVSGFAATPPVTTPSASPPVFADGFETGDLTAWTTSGGLTVQSSDVRNGGFAAEGNTTNGGAFAKRTLGATYADAYARVGVEVKSQSAQVNLLRMRDAAGNSIGYLFLSPTGFLGFHDDATNVNTSSTVVPGAGWHGLELHLGINGTASTVEVWLDGAPVPGLSAGNVDLGVAPVGALQVGETQLAQTYDVVYDDVAFGTSRLGPTGDVTAPTAPVAPTVTATSAFSVRVDWTATSDDIGVTSYDVFRDGALLVSVGTATPTYTDTTVLAASTHGYAVRARDAANNVSAMSPEVATTTPAAAAPVFANGFESGNLTAWTTSGGLSVQSTDVRTGGFAVEGNTTNGNTFAKKTLPATYADAYGRVGYKLKSQAAQVNLLRMRDAAGNSIGYLYLSTTGQLAFHNDATNTNTVSTVVPASGWHALELHLGVNGTNSTIEAWIDGAAVPALTTTTVNLGTAPVGTIQVGETQTGRTYDVLLDDAAFGTSRIGPS